MGKPPNYRVRYRKIGTRKWTVVENVIGDTVLSNAPDHDPGKVTFMPVRVLLLEDNRRIEVSLTGTELEFSVERYYHIKEKMSNEAGQEIRTVQ